MEARRAPYQRSDDFSADRLQPVWQWNHVPLDDKWSLRERPGFLRLHALAAADLWHARNTLTQRAIGPRSSVTAILDASALKHGDVAGLALFNRPYAWLGVERGNDGLVLIQFDEVTGITDRAPLKSARVWLRADCDFVKNVATFQLQHRREDLFADRRPSRDGIRAHHLPGRALFVVLVSHRA